ncbi:oligopeptidase A, partial [Acinetobacter baumannii]
MTLDNLKQDIQQAIQAVQEFLNTLTAAPSETDQQLAVLEQIDALENKLSESWGVLSPLNAVMNNAETREVYLSLLPDLSEYYTQVGQHTALYQTYQLIHDSQSYSKLSP